MSTTFVIRHPGAIEWMKKQPIHIDYWTDSLNINDVKAGDCIIGILPMHLAAQVCAKGAEFIALCIELPKEKRGKELSVNQLEALSCSLTSFHVEAKSSNILNALEQRMK